MANPENICVGCETPLVRGQRYGVRRGQLWHSHCFIAFGGKANRERELERRLSLLEQNVQDECRQTNEMRRQREEQRTRAVMAETERDTARTSVKMLTQSRASLQRELAATRDIHTMTRNDLDRVQRELAEAQRELALARVVSTPPINTAVAGGTGEVAASPKSDDDDYAGTAKRFELLELD